MKRQPGYRSEAILPIPRSTTGGEDGRLPIEPARIDSSGTPGFLLGQTLLLPLEQLVSDDDDPGALVVAQQFQHLELFVDILLRHGRQTGDLGNTRGKLRRWGREAQ